MTVRQRLPPSAHCDPCHSLRYGDDNEHAHGQHHPDGSSDFKRCYRNSITFTITITNSTARQRRTGSSIWCRGRDRERPRCCGHAIRNHRSRGALPGTALQVFGSLPNEARMALNVNSHSCKDITPKIRRPKAASLHQVVALPDGSVVAFGSRAGDDGGGMPMEVPGSWLTRDGRNWAPAKLNINGEPILDIISAAGDTWQLLEQPSVTGPSGTRPSCGTLRKSLVVQVTQDRDRSQPAPRASW